MSRVQVLLPLPQSNKKSPFAEGHFLFDAKALGKSLRDSPRALCRHRSSLCSRSDQNTMFCSGLTKRAARCCTQKVRNAISLRETAKNDAGWTKHGKIARGRQTNVLLLLSVFKFKRPLRKQGALEMYEYQQSMGTYKTEGGLLCLIREKRFSENKSIPPPRFCIPKGSLL